MCPTSDEASCADAFEFIALTEQSGLSSFEDGIIGLWSGYTWYDNPSLYVPWLQTSGTISENIFSFYMTGLSGTSYIDFGTPDASIIGDGSEIFWMDKVEDSPWWANYVYGMKWGGGMGDEYERSFSATQAITDTGSSCLVGPS